MKGFCLLLLVHSFILSSIGEYYTFDGTGNNENNDDWGSVGVMLRRLSGESDLVTFSDGIQVSCLVYILLLNN